MVPRGVGADAHSPELTANYLRLGQRSSEVMRFFLCAPISHRLIMRQDCPASSVYLCSCMPPVHMAGDDDSGALCVGQYSSTATTIAG
jgi:hypothetical protein